MRRPLVAALVSAVVLTGLLAQPAAATSKAPSRVGLVSFVKADYNRSTDRAALSLDWPDAKRAEKYEIFVSKYASMKKAKRYASRSSKTTLKNLSRGADYFVQVRGVNGKKHGSKSTVVGHTAILRPGPATGLLPLRILTYNVCSRVCGVTTWNAYRQAGVLERVAAAGADIVATQEADNLVVPPGYELAISKSAKRLYYKPGRLAVAPVDPAQPVYPKPAETSKGCSPTYQWGQPTGYVWLGYHGSGCRYAVWTEFVDIATQRHFLMVDVHLVTGDGATPTRQRREEVNELLSNIALTNVKGLPVLYAGDVNSHRLSKGGDSVRSVMNANKLYDGYDLARRLTDQHINSFQGFKATPTIGYLWGNHIDKVWVNPYTTRIDSWQNFALKTPGGRLAQPNPSDHSPVLVNLRIG